MNKTALYLMIFLIIILICIGVVYWMFFYNAPTMSKPLGIVYNPEYEIVHQKTRTEDLKDMEDIGLGVAQLYVGWQDAQYNQADYEWQYLDQEIKAFHKRGWRISVCFPVINGKYLDNTTSDSSSTGIFNNTYREQYRKFIMEVLQRYNEEINFVIIGKEVDRYLVYRSDSINAYDDFFIELNTAIKKEYPAIEVGTSYSYDHLKEGDNFAAFLASNKLVGDFVAFTYYNIDYDYKLQNLGEVERDFKEMLEYAGNKKLAIMSTGYGAADHLNSDEEIQASFVQKFVDFVGEHRALISFANYFTYHDPPAEYCDALATAQLPGVVSSEQQRWADWLCSSGLKNEFREKRVAWYIWQDRENKYLFD